MSVDENVTGVFAQAGAVAVRTFDGLVGLGIGADFFFLDFGFGFGVEAFGVEAAFSGVAVTATGGAPAPGGVEGEVMGVELLE